ncbi:hypothetical protein GMST_22040 [Geomonas silvestris]|uniref:Uncharacterized protein n=1 Tax=Geomonas silvestris TaxID=2740184 RepID=A0A6V8MJM0_9BACT|nr:hypothetical protein GMST_22040 [Geomonas silvestris]
MREAMISGQECLVGEVSQSTRAAGVGLWFLDQQPNAAEAWDAVAVFTGAAAHLDRSTGSSESDCTPFNCVSCAGAALCGGRATIN